MAITPAQLRTDFPEFSSTASYPDPQLVFYLAQAYLLLSADRWGNVLDTGAELYAAHFVVLEFKANAESNNGAPPGISTGPVNSKSVDKVSAGYDTASAAQKDAGHWNNTVYGTRFIRLARMFGAGPVQVGLPGPGCSVGVPWSGPNCAPGWLGS